MKDTKQVKPEALTMLENPLWFSLQTSHKDVALVAAKARRYPSQIAPFGSVKDSSAEASDDLDSLVHVGETIALLSVMPQISDRWQTQKEFEIHQYVRQGREDAEPHPDVCTLGDADLAQMLELTGLVYPAYFRAGTAKLGTYYGIKREGQLVAMAGIRMSMPGLFEISAICTHLNYRGKGLAVRLIRHICAHLSAKGDVPFLHTEFDNAAGKALYEKTGFSLRAAMPFRVQTKLR